MLKGAVIGKDCNIGDHCFVECGVTIGDEVVIKNGVSIWEGVTIEDRVFVGPNVSFTNDRVPRAKVFRDEYDKLLVKEGASIGANATIVGSVVIGRFAMIGAGAVVVNDVPDFGLVYGNPAELRDWVCKCGKKLDFEEEKVSCGCGIEYVKDGPQITPVPSPGATGQASPDKKCHRFAKRTNSLQSKQPE